MKKIKKSFKTLIEFTSNVNKNEGFSKLYLFFDFFINMFLYGFTIRQYFSFGVYKMPRKFKKTYVNRWRAIKLEKWFNNSENCKYLNNKKLFNEKYSSFVRRKWIDLKVSNTNEIKSFINENKQCIIKPYGLSSGRGIRLITSFNEITTNELGHEYLLEERVINHSVIKKLSNLSLNTCRVYTLKNKKGEVIILSASLRIGAANSIIDNMHGNGHAVPIDVYKGILIGSGKSYDHTIYDINPNSGKYYVGIQLPYWKQVLKCVNYACSVLNDVRYNAWDIAITEKGCELIEGNVVPDPNLMQMFLKQGNYKTFKESR